MTPVFLALCPTAKTHALSRFLYRSTFKEGSNTCSRAHSHIRAVRPTIDARKELYAAAKKKAEEIKVQVRKHHAASLKRGKYEKHSIELEEVRLPPRILYHNVLTVSKSQFQKLTDKYVKETDKILADLQKATGAK